MMIKTSTESIAFMIAMPSKSTSSVRTSPFFVHDFSVAMFWFPLEMEPLSENVLNPGN